MADDAPRRITLSSIGCFPILFGSAFAGMGIVILTMLLTNPSAVKVDGRPGRRDDAWFPFIFIAIGLGVAGIRYRRVVDLDARSIETRFGWGPLTALRVAELGEWRAVEIGREESRGSGSGQYTAVPVRMVGASATKEIAAPRQADKARALAASIARGAGIALRDAGGEVGRVVETPADRIGEPLLPRLSDADLRADEPTPNRLRIDEGVHGVRVRTPATGLGCGLVGAAMPMAMFGLFWWFLWRPLLHDPKVPFVFAIAPLLMGALPAAVVLIKTLRGGGAIEADDAEGLRARDGRIARDDLTGLDVVEIGGRGYLRATSADRELKLAVGCTRAELQWLRVRLLRALKG